MDNIIPSTSVKHYASSPLARWALPSCQITLLGQEALKGIVEDRETGLSYQTEVRSPFKSAAQVPATVKRDFYAKVVSSQGIPVAIELCPRGMGGGKFYTQPAVLLQPLFQKASLNRDPKTPQELVSVFKQIPAGDQRLTRYLGFASQFIKTFSANPTLMKDQIDGLVTLVLSENQDITHSVINELTKRIRNNTLLNLDLVHGLADAIDRANPTHLNADDLVQIMFTIVERIAKTHTKGAEKSQEAQLEALTRVLNSMVDANVCDLSRDRQEDIKKLLGKFSDSDSIGVQCLVAYAKEALTRVPNDETKLAAFFRVSVGFAKGIYFFYAAVNKLDPGKLVDGFFALQESAQGILNFAKQIKEGFLDALPDAQEGLQALKEGTSSLRLRKLAWYDQLRYVEMLIASNSFQALEALLLNPRLQKDPVFFYAIVEKLHEVVVSHPNVNVRIETLRLIQNLYQDDKTWSNLTFKEDHYKNEGPGKLELTNRDAIRRWMGIKGAVVSHLTSYQQIPELKGPAAETLGTLTQNAKGEERAFISRYKDSAPKIASPVASHTPLFAPKAKEQFALEAKIEKARAFVVEDPGFIQEKPLYVPLMGSPYAGSPTTFNLGEEVQRFLKGDQKVLLLLGPSGSGKTFFSHILSEMLWDKYQPEVGTIPFFISLPTVKDPSQKLVQQALKRFGFTVEEIAKLKDAREIVWILDSYDEITPNTDLLDRNDLLDFKGKVIVTSRTEALPSSDLFIPTVGGKSKKSLLKEIYFAPFSSSQMDHFIGKYIQMGSTEWKEVSQYRKHIDEIHGLFELVQNPFVLKIIVDTLPEIIDRHKQAPSDKQLTITRYSLYEVFIDEWFQKGFVRAKKQFTELKAAGLRPDNLKKEAMAFCTHLANAMQTQGLTHVEYDVGTPNPVWDTWLTDEPKLAYLRSMSPLKITPGDCAFLHKSLMEYFIAEGAKTTLVQRKLSLQTAPKENTSFSVKGVPIFNALLEPSVWFFLADLAKSDAAFKQELWSLMEQSKTHPEMAIAAANAASIWNFANFSFSRKDLRGVRIPGAHLEKANLVGADLRGADLTKAILSGAVLSNALFDSVKMEGVQFGQSPYIKTYADKLIASSDGKQLIVCVDKTICIWDVLSGQLLKKLEGHTGDIRALILLEGGKKLVSASKDMTIRIWDLESGKELKRLEGHTGEVDALTLLEGGKLASGSIDKTIRIWNPVSGKELKKLKGHQGDIRALIPLQGGKRIASRSNDKTIRIWDIDSGKELTKLEGDTEWVTILVPVEGGKKLASGGLDLDKTIRIWDTDTGKELKKLEGHTGSIKVLISLEGGSKLASASDDQTIRIWDIESGKELKKLEGHTHNVKALILLEGGKKLASGSGDNTVRIWDIELGKELIKLEGHTRYVKSLISLEGGNKLASSGDDGIIRIWDLDFGNKLKKPVGHTSWVTTLTLLEGGKQLASGSSDDTIRIWDLDSGKELKRLEGHKGGVSALILLEGGKQLASGSYDRTIRIWDIETGKELQKLEGYASRTVIHRLWLESGKGKVRIPDPGAGKDLNEPGGHSISALTLLDGGRKLASGSNDYTVRVWDLESGKELKELVGHTRGVSALILLEGGKKLVSGAEGIRIWDIESGKELKKLEGHTNDVKALTLLEGGKKLASGGHDQTIRIWDIESGEELKKLEGHTDWVDALTSLDGGKKLASGSHDNTIRIWNIESGKELLNIPCPFSISSLTSKEPNLLLAGDNRGGIWCWKLNFQEKDFQPQLIWLTNPNLTCSETKLGTPIGLSEPNERLLLQHGATAEKQ